MKMRLIENDIVYVMVGDERKYARISSIHSGACYGLWSFDLSKIVMYNDIELRKLHVHYDYFMEDSLVKVDENDEEYRIGRIMMEMGYDNRS